MQFQVHLGQGRANTPAWLRGWVGAVLGGLLSIVIIAGLFLFFTVFIAVGAIALLVFGVRLWWRMRKMRGRSDRRQYDDVIDAKHSVIDVEVIEGGRDE